MMWTKQLHKFNSTLSFILIQYIHSPQREVNLTILIGNLL